MSRQLLFVVAVVVLIALIAPLVFLTVRQGNRVEDKWPKEIENTLGMKLVRIPPGTFQMGFPSSDERHGADEQQHEVEITKEFWLGVYEVTQKGFKEIRGYNPSCFSHDGKGGAGLTYGDEPAERKDQVPVDTSEFPVENVSYEEAVMFCKMLTTKEAGSGRIYRLPTEAEWEYACRGGARSYQAFSFGNSLSSKQANFAGNYPDVREKARPGDYLARTCKVGSYPANAFGLKDMHGNVYEWCADWYGEDYYARSPRRDPQGPSEGSRRIIRGGCWNEAGLSSRSAWRNARAPSKRDNDLGFRVVLIPAVQ